MSIRLGVLLLVVSGCATAPVRDDDAERVEKSMAPEKPGDEPGGIAFDSKSAPPLAKGAFSSPSVTTPLRGRGYRHSTPMSSDMSRAMQPGTSVENVQVTVP